jgi:hypothetical protein
MQFCRGRRRQSVEVIMNNPVVFRSGWHASFSHARRSHAVTLLSMALALAGAYML